jgi:F420-non-reducing hydrogenase iron-sulfur subunit
LNRIYLCKKLIEQIGLSPDRLQIGWVSSSEGVRFSSIITEFTKQIKKLGPLGEGKVEKIAHLRLKLEAAKNLVPYLKLIEINKIRLPLDTAMGYEEFSHQVETNRLFQVLIRNELIISEILLLLKEKGMSAEELSNSLELSVSEVSQCIHRLAERGLIRVDDTHRRFIHTTRQKAMVGAENEQGEGSRNSNDAP